MFALSNPPCLSFPYNFKADFTVYNNKKKQARKVFLFEDLILFSKAKKQAVQGDCFVYKTSLKVTVNILFAYNLFFVVNL